mgnify:CR=1 FL=1
MLYRLESIAEVSEVGSASTNLEVEKVSVVPFQSSFCRPPSPSPPFAALQSPFELARAPFAERVSAVGYIYSPFYTFSLSLFHFFVALLENNMLITAAGLDWTGKKCKQLQCLFICAVQSLSEERVVTQQQRQSKSKK